MSSILSKTPIARIVFPYALGIIFAYYLYCSSIYAIITIILCLMAYFIFLQSPKTKLNQQYIYSILLACTCFCFGIINHNITKPDTSCISKNSEYIANGKIIKILDNDFSSNAHIQLINVTDSCGNKFNVNTKITTWIEYNDYSVNVGDVLTFKFSPKKLSNRGNPEEFDYAEYLKSKGFTHHTFINHNDYKIVEHHNDFNSFCNKLQNKAINLFLNSSLNPDTKTFFITILLGDSSMLNDETKELFSHAGIAHILALSGLHIGIILLILSIVLYPLDYLRLKQLRFIITLLTIILYAVVTGLSVSVIRATIMITFVIISKLIYRKNTSLNALFIAALIILIVNPLSILDIGFQFSFLTVFLILILSNYLTIISPKQKLLYYFASIVIISVISAVGTLWLSAYYFNYISLLSVFSNILIVPILPIIIGLGILHLFFLSIGIDSSISTNILNTCYRIITDISQSISQIPISYIDFIYVSPCVLGLIFVGLLFLILFLTQKRSIYLYCTIIILISASILSHYEKHLNPDYGYVIFNDFNQTSILIFNNNQATHLISESNQTNEKFISQHRRFISKYEIDNINTIQLNQGTSYYTLPGGKTMAILNSNETKHIIKSPRINIDMIIVTKNYYGNINDILRCYNTEMIVFSGDIFHKRLQLLIDECIKLGIRHHSVADEGAIFESFSF